VSRPSVCFTFILLIFRRTAFQLQLVLLLLLVMLPLFVPTQQHGCAAHHSCTQQLPKPWNLQQHIQNDLGHSSWYVMSLGWILLLSVELTWNRAAVQRKLRCCNKASHPSKPFDPRVSSRHCVLSAAVTVSSSVVISDLKIRSIAKHFNALRSPIQHRLIAYQTLCVPGILSGSADQCIPGNVNLIQIPKQRHSMKT